MAEETKTTSSIAKLAIAATVGLAGGIVATTQGTETTIQPINAETEMSIFTSGVSNVEATGMAADKSFPSHLHIKWDANPNTKYYDVYVDGTKKNNAPIVVIGDTGRYTDLVGFKAGKTYTVTVAAYGVDGKQTQSEPISVKAK